MKQVISTSIMLGAAALSGCSPQLSTADYSLETKDQPAGLAYALPTTLFCIDGQVLSSTTDQPADKPATAPAATATVTFAGTSKKPGSSPDSTVPTTSDVNICPSSAAAKPAPSPKTGEAQHLQVTITAVVVPDPSTHFYAQLIDNAFDDEDTQISIGKNMLLNSATTAPQSEYGAVIVNVAKAATEIVPHIMTLGPPSGKNPTTNTAEPLVNFHRVYTYSELIKAYKQPGQSIPLPNGLTIGFANSDLNQGLVYGAPKIACAHSLCFRRKRTIALNLHSSGLNSAEDPDKILSFMVPDQDAIIGVDLTSAPFVKRQTKLAFSDGLLTSNSIKQPSVALAVSEVPLDIFKTVAGGAASAVPINARYDSADIEKGMAAQGSAAEKPPAATTPQ